jgi:hypothetical protein
MTLEDNTPQFPRETDRIPTEARNIQRKVLPETASMDARRLQTCPDSPPSRIVMSPLSPSVYSRDTDGLSIVPNDSVVSLSNSHHREQPAGGSAIILNSHSVRSYVIGTPSPDRSQSTRTSRDWKAWLSHEISGIETPSKEELKISERFVTPCRNEQQLSHKAAPQAVHEPSMEPDETCQIHEMASQGQSSESEGDSPSNGTTNDNVGSTLAILEECTDRTAQSMSDAQSTPRHVSRPLNFNRSSVSTPSSSLSAVQLPADTPPSARMNDRFPFISTGRRSSSYTSKLSGRSKSPYDSTSSFLKTPKTMQKPKVYTSLPLSVTDITLQKVSSTPENSGDNQLKRKENLIPTTTSASKSSITLSGRVSRPTSLQPLSPVVPNYSPKRITLNPDGVVKSRSEKLMPSNEDPVVSQTRIQATLRPISPEKLARRPKSAFDLRSTPTLSSSMPRISVVPTTSVPGSRRNTMYPLKSPSHQPGAPGTPGADPSVPNTQSAFAISEEGRNGSVTPGQRMADSFLKARKSGTDLVRREKASGSCLVREDTPAFL